MRHLIGSRLRELRESKGLSLREAASRAGLSRTFVAVVERGESEIAVSRLIRLADIYGAGVSDLLESVRNTQAEFVRKSETHVFPTGMDSVDIRYMASPSWEVQPFRVQLEPGARFEDLRHPGDEFIHCLEGNPTMVIDGASYPMDPGDTVVVPSEHVHSYFNKTNSRAIVVGAVARPDARRKRSVV
jgi:transcriptional regulator with XRE-family HTH domain